MAARKKKAEAAKLAVRTFDDRDVSEFLRALAAFHGIGTINFEGHQFAYLGIRGKAASLTISLSQTVRYLAKNRKFPPYDFKSRPTVLPSLRDAKVKR